MSPLNTQKLAATAPAASVGAKLTPPSGDKTSLSKPNSSAVAQQGVNVELSTRVEAGKPPFDSDRVAQIRAALQDGSYPVLPAEIADAMIAARLMLAGSK